MQISVSNLWEYVWWFYCLTTFPLPSPVSPRERVFYIISRESFYPRVYAPPGQGVGSWAPLVCPAYWGRGRWGVGVWVWPTLIMESGESYGIVNSLTSFAFDHCSLHPYCSLETWVLVTLSRHCPDGEVTTGQERARPGVLCGPGHSARCSHECQALSCELVVTEGGRVQSELHAPIMLSRTLSPSALLLTLSQLSHLASGARDTGANVPSDLVTGRTIWL